MPSTITHYIFNKELVKDKKYQDIFLLAGQGADVFFFYGYFLLNRKNAKNIRKLGIDIHQMNPDILFYKMLEYAFSKQGEEKDILVNFTRGFMYHYALDRNIHPYVFYNTGFPYSNKKYNLYHGRLESIIDTLLAKEYNVRISTRKAIKTNKKYIRICSKMLCEVVNDYFNENILEENSYYKAYKDFRLIRLILDSKYGIKKWIFNKVLKNSTINAICQPNKVRDDVIYDYLNKSNKVWINPSSGLSVNYSIKDLFEIAKSETRIIDTIIYNFKNNIVTQRKITKYTYNINHDGRNLDRYMTYFKIIWNGGGK